MPRGVSKRASSPASIPPNTDSVGCDEGAFHRTPVMIEHGTRRIRLAGITANQDGA